MTPPPAEFNKVSTAPAQGAALTSLMVEVGGDVDRLGLSSSGSLVVSSAGTTHEFTGGALQKRTLYAAQGEQTSLGAVTAISPRLAGGAWLSAANGLFELEGLYVTRSPLSAGLVAVSVDQPRGPLAGLWLGTDDGLVRRSADDTQRFKLDGVAPQVTQLAIEPNGKAALAVMDGRIFVFRPSGTGIVAERPPAMAGSPHAVAASADMLFAATGSGLWRYDVASEAVAWTQLTLSAGDPKKIEALAADPVSGVLWARAAGELLKIEGDSSTTFSVPAAMQGFTVDQLGDVWLPSGKQLLRLKIGDAMPVSFATELKPWLTQHCTVCHADFAELTPFSMRAEAALFRVTTGDMPRCTGGTPCPSDQRLKDYAVLEQWIRSGKQP